MICAQELKKQKTNVYLILISRNCWRDISS
jgi:hypothetical protein